MEIADYGIIVSSESSCENGCVLVLFSQNYGKISGYFKRTGYTIPQIGDLCYFRIQKRIDVQLGQINIELIKSTNHAFRLANRTRLLTIKSICEIINMYIYCEDTYEDLYLETVNCIENICDLKRYALWELIVLQNLGYGLDLAKCCITSQTDGLTYISPKTGKAVVQKIGERYKDKLFKIPHFWLNEYNPVIKDIIESLKITGYFLGKLNEHIGLNKHPIFRSMLLDCVERSQI